MWLLPFVLLASACGKQVVNVVNDGSHTFTWRREQDPFVYILDGKAQNAKGEAYSVDTLKEIAWGDNPNVTIVIPEGYTLYRSHRLIEPYERGLYHAWYRKGVQFKLEDEKGRRKVTMVTWQELEEDSPLGERRVLHVVDGRPLGSGKDADQALGELDVNANSILMVLDPNVMGPSSPHRSIPYSTSRAIDSWRKKKAVVMLMGEWVFARPGEEIMK